LKAQVGHTYPIKIRVDKTDGQGFTPNLMVDSFLSFKNTPVFFFQVPGQAILLKMLIN
jgi:hypothetical protein